ncbi:glycine-rich protein DOT1 [Sorghum bicolor]|uniref:HMA domain-containing protein n=1 Tax=Sorghum bicolor TaxID=4558 RepID=C5WWM3_SORBI|nr:glycine-rich protein DOT1 [Sorghum bicolor]XP_021311904.1 glycine-rich protein DOT1 [Sorghum bicolor]EER94696.1 hypothetical protein SORBI_3001G339400 [Sorghum bicolor]|eukprot:XP_002467698.1 glycine-rich protein DOT1 [Sorghum bicolor]
MSTVVMRVDLECEKCYKKIRKVLCKVQDKVSIRTISYDEKNNTVTVSGPFDAEEVADRLTSDAGKVITDIHVVGGFGGFALGGGGGGKQKHGAAAATPGKAPKTGKANGNGHGHGQGKGHGHGGHGGGGGHGGHGGGGHGGGKPEKKHVKFDDLDLDMDDDDFDLDDMDEPVGGRNAHSGHGHGHGHGNGGGKPQIIRTTNTPIAARLEAPRTGPAMSMATAAPVRMPMPAMGPMPQQHGHHAQGMGVPSIWPAAAAPEWGYSTQPYGSYSGPPAGGYYGGAYGGAAGHWPYGGGYGRNPYAQQQYYEEEPSAGCSVM